MAGFVYVMTNEAFPHLVKIGKSAKDPRQDRVNELNHTGVPQPFRVEYYAFVEDEGSIERWLHSYFDNHRINKAREFFQIGVAEAIVAVRDAANLRGGIKYEEVFYISQAELEAKRRKDEEERKKLERFNAIRQAEAAAKRERDSLLAEEQRAAEERRRQQQERAQERAVAEERLRQAAAAEQAEREYNKQERQYWKKEFSSMFLVIAGGLMLLPATVYPIFWVPFVGLLVLGMRIRFK